MQPLPSATSAKVLLSFGMLGVTVSVHGAIGEDDSSSLRTVCINGHDAAAVKQALICPVCGNDHRSTFARAREVGEGLVVVPAEVIAEAKAASEPFKKSIALTVHPVDQVSAVLLPSGKSYYLSLNNASPAAREQYSLLGKLVAARSDLAFMGKFTLRSATSVFRLVVAGEGTLLLQQMADAELVRQHPVIEFAEVTARALELAGMLADSLVTTFDPADHGTSKTDIVAKYAGSQTPVAASVTAVEGGTVLDLTAMLEASLTKKAPKVAAPRKPRKNTAAEKVS